MARLADILPLIIVGAVLVVLGGFAYAYWPNMVGYAQSLQMSLHRDLADAIHAVKAREGAAFWSLIVLSFLYGIFHAVGPGHGKVVIATYIASHPERLKRGLMISVLSSLTQGVTAILMVGLGFWLFELTARGTRFLANHLETVSFGLIAILGLYLMFRAVRRIIRRARHREHHHHDHHHHHGHDGCGHDHGLSAFDGDVREGWLATAGIILSVGIRPCSGAILLLILAAALDLMISGGLAVLAMSLGTAITVATLAVLARAARRYAEWVADRMPGEGGFWQIGGDMAAAAGGLVILLFGISLLEVALAPQSHPLF